MKTHAHSVSAPLASLSLFCSALLLLAGCSGAFAANILWVSDNGSDNTFSAPGDYPDGGFLTILQNAGHTVTRYNGPNDPNTRLSQAVLDQINSYDLIILGRAVGSGAFVNPQVIDWNVNVTKPLLTINAYLARSTRLGWCTGETMINGTPTPVTAINLSDPIIGYIFSEVAMAGSTTANVYDEALYQNTSQILQGPVTGGRVLATANFTDLGGTARNNIPIIMEWPAGTVVRGGADVLGGYRMYFAASSREPASGGNTLVHCVENLTATGENMFLKAVEIAVFSGQLPFDPNAPVGFAQDLPTAALVPEGTLATLSITVTGAAPRQIQWQRDDGAGDFTNIVGATSASLFLGIVNPPRDGELYRVIASNANGSATSTVARLTVAVDTNAPQVVRISADPMMNRVSLRFNEPVRPQQALDLNNYALDPPVALLSVDMTLDGLRVELMTDPLTPGQRYTLTLIEGLADRSYYTNWLPPLTQLQFSGWVNSPGFLTVQRYLGISGNAISDLINHAKYPYRWDDVFHVNSAQTVQSAPNTDNYGGRLLGWIITPEAGFYTFFIRGDDGTELRLGNSDDFASLSTIAQQTSANQPFTSGQSSSIYLDGGQRYAVEALWKEGTGGDYVQVAWQPPSGTAPVIIPASALEGIADPSAVTLSLTSQPQSRIVFENRSHTFTAGAEVTPAGTPLVYTWQRGDGLGGFTNAAVTITNGLATPVLTLADNQSQWRVLVAAPGVVATSEVATLTISSDDAPPQIVRVINSPGNPTAVTIEFDEVVDRILAEEITSYRITNLVDNSEVPLDANLLPILAPEGRAVTLFASVPLTNNTFYMVEALAMDPVGNMATLNARITRVGLLAPSGPQNLVVFEAEDFDEMVPRVWEGVERYWTLVTNRADFSGRGAMRALPNTEGNRPTGNEAASLDFFVTFPEAGTYFVWVRGGAEGGADNSCNVGLNNAVPDTGNNVQQGFDLGQAGWHWGSVRDGGGGGRVSLDILSAGVHRVQIYMREDGFYCDKILLTTDVNYSPVAENGGLGPQPTERAVSEPVLQVEAAPATEGLQLIWPFFGTQLWEADNILGPWTPVLNATSPYTAPLSGAQKFYRVVLP